MKKQGNKREKQGIPLHNYLRLYLKQENWLLEVQKIRKKCTWKPKTSFSGTFCFKIIEICSKSRKISWKLYLTAEKTILRYNFTGDASVFTGATSVFARGTSVFARDSSVFARPTSVSPETPVFLPASPRIIPYLNFFAASMCIWISFSRSALIVT